MVTITLALLAFAADWSQFRGEHGAGATAEAIPEEFGPTKNVRWKAPVPAGHSSPVVWRGSVYLTGWDSTAKKLLLLSYDARTGVETWRREVAVDKAEKVHQVSNPATGTVAADAQHVYAYFGSAGLFAFDHGGKPVWSVPMQPPSTRFGSGSSPVLIGDLVVLNRDEMQASALFAFDRKTGKEVWKVANAALPGGGGSESYSTPVQWKGHLVLHRAGEVVAHDPADGKRVWWVRGSTTGTSTPAATEDALYVATWTLVGEADQLPPLPDFSALLARGDKDGDGALTMDEFPADVPLAGRPGMDGVPGANMTVRPFLKQLDSNKNSKIEEKEWQGFLQVVKMMTTEHGMIAISPGGSGDITVSHVRWKEKKSVPEVPSPVALKDRVYMIRNGGVLTALRTDTGAVAYRERANAPGAYYASLIAAGGRVVAASAEGKVTVIRPGEKLDIAMQADFGEPIFATPAVAGGALYIRTAGHLYAIAARE